MSGHIVMTNTRFALQLTCFTVSIGLRERYGASGSIKAGTCWISEVTSQELRIFEISFEF